MGDPGGERQAGRATRDGTLAEMVAEHADLRAAMAEMRVVLGARDLPLLHPLRWRLSFLIARHVSVEDSHIYPLLVGDPRPHVAAIVQRFTGRIGELKARAVDWRTAWNGSRVEADWAGFVRATDALLDELDRRMEMEERELFPLIRAVEQGR